MNAADPVEQPADPAAGAQPDKSTANRLDRSLVSGIAWTASMRWFAQIISWAATLYAARVLLPGDYGIVAMASIPIGLARMAEDFGLDAVLVQDRTIDNERQARLAGFALLLGVFLMVVFAAASYPVAAFFKEPAVALVICALSVTFVLDALQIVPKAMLQRELQFKRLAIVWLVQVTFTSAALVLAARYRFGYWALIVNTLAGGIAATLLLFWWRPYRIAWPRGMASLAGPIRQGWRILMSRAAWYAYTSMDQTVVGKVLGKDALGAYGFATTFANLPMQEITSVVSRVVPGVFTQVQQNRSELRRYFLVLTEFLSYLAFPVGAGIALTADLVVQLALGPQWQAVVDPLRILCIYAAFSASQTLIAHLLMWTGQFRALMWCSILTGVVLPISFIFGAQQGGLVGVAWMWAILFPLTNVPPLAIGFRTIGITLSDWLDVMKAPLIACGAMAVVVFVVRMEVPDSIGPMPALACEALAGAATYVATLALFFRTRLMVILDTVRAVRKQVAPAV